jgi:hypothetical protein
MEEPIIDNRPTRAQEQDQLLREAIAVANDQAAVGFVPHDPALMRVDDDHRNALAAAFEAGLPPPQRPLDPENPWEALPLGLLPEPEPEVDPPPAPDPPVDQRDAEAKWEAFLVDDDNFLTAQYGYDPERHRLREQQIISSPDKPISRLYWWWLFCGVCSFVLLQGLVLDSMCTTYESFHSKIPTRPYFEYEKDESSFRNWISITRGFFRMFWRFGYDCVYEWTAVLRHARYLIYYLFDTKIIHDSCAPHSSSERFVICWLFFSIAALYLKTRVSRKHFKIAPVWWRVAVIASALTILVVLASSPIVTITEINATPGAIFVTPEFVRWKNYVALNSFCFFVLMFHPFIWFWPRTFWTHQLSYRNWSFDEEDKYDTNSKGETKHFDPKLGVHVIHKVWGWLGFRQFISRSMVSVELALQACNPNSMSLLSDRNTSLERLDRFINTNQTVNVPRYAMLSGEHIYQNSLLLSSAFRDSFELGREDQVPLGYSRPP